MFETASRLKLVFNSPKGLLKVEDLWDLPLTSKNGVNLNDIARGLNRELMNSDENVSFVDEVSSTSDNAILKLKFDIVKHIIDVKLSESRTAREASIRKAERTRILELIERKKGEALESRSIEELEALLKSTDTV